MVTVILAVIWLAIGLATQDKKPGLLLTILLIFLIGYIKSCNG